MEEEEDEIFAELDLEETIEDSHPSELEDIIEEVNRVELRVDSNILKPSATIESDSDSSSSASSSDSDSDLEYDSDYSYKGMKNSETGMGIPIKWDGNKTTYDEFIYQYKDWLLFTNKTRFFSYEIHPKLHPDGEDAYEDLEVKSRTKRKQMRDLFNDHRKCIAKLRMSVPRAVITNLIDNTVVEGVWPHGRLWLALKAIHVAFNVPDKFAKKQLKLDIEAIVMFADDEDPDLVYRRLENVQTKYTLRPSIMPTCDELLMQLIDGSADKYQTLYATKISAMPEDHVHTQADIDEFKRSANVLYLTSILPKKKIKKGSKHSFKDSSGNDIALFTAPSNKGNGGNGRNRRNGGNNNADGKKFTGVCYHCNKKGHKANQCWQKDKGRQDGKGDNNSNKTGGNNNGKAKCGHCGKPGHSEKFCWDKDCNAHQRPENWTKRAGVSDKEVSQASLICKDT